MIYIEVAPYCQDCPEFDPDAECERTICEINGKPLKLLGNTTVRCKHRERCGHIKQYLERYLTCSMEESK